MANCGNECSSSGCSTTKICGGNTSSSGSNCCCNTNFRISSSAFDDENRGDCITTSGTRNSLESNNIQIYHRPFSETPDIFKAHIPTSASCYIQSYRDSSTLTGGGGDKNTFQHNIPFGDCIGPSHYGNVNITTATGTQGTSNLVYRQGGGIGPSSIARSIESPCPVSLEIASLSTASPSSCSTTNAGTSSSTAPLYTCGRRCDLTGQSDGGLTDYTALLTPLSIFTDVTSDSRNDSTFHNAPAPLLPTLYPENSASETALITSSTSSSTALPAEMDIGCVSSFDQKLYHAFTSPDEDVTWNQFQGPLSSSLGRKYLQKSPIPPSIATVTGSCASEKTAKRSTSSSNTSKTFRSVRRWICPSRQVFSVTTATPGSATAASQTSSSSPSSRSYVDESNYHVPNSNGSIDSFCSPFKIPQIMIKESPRERSNRSIVLIGIFLLSLTILVTSGGFIFNHLINRISRVSNSESSNFILNQRKYWWRDAIFYEIFPASFKDTDSNGFGDLKGVTSKIPYIKELGVTGIRLNSIFTALDYPHQFDHVIDFKDVDPKIGTIDDFKILVKQLHQHGLTLILDINPSVTSDQHPWAISWLANKSSEYSSFYVINSQNVSITITITVNSEHCTMFYSSHASA